METPPSTIQRISKLNYFSLRESAMKAGNIDAFNALEEEKNLKGAVEILGLTEEYEKYLSTVKDEKGRLYDESIPLISKFYNFVLAKICFPEDFEDVTGTNISVRQLKYEIPERPKLTAEDFKGEYGDLLKLDLEQLEELAIKNNNLDAYKTLFHHENYGLASSYLELEHAYEAYRATLREALHTSREKVEQVEKDYERFLLLQICFPETFK